MDRTANDEEIMERRADVKRKSQQEWVSAARAISEIADNDVLWRTAGHFCELAADHPQFVWHAFMSLVNQYRLTRETHRETEALNRNLLRYQR